MLIPQELQHFPHPTLIIVADHIHAYIWLAHEDKLEQINEINMPRELSDGREGVFVNAEHGGSTSTVEPHDEDRLRKFITAIVEDMEKRLRDKQAVKFHIVAQSELCHAIQTKLSHDCQPSATWNVEADLIKISIIEILERILSSGTHHI